MSKIDLTSQEWNDLVFEGRNKNYGAYDMRKNSNKRHITALIIILLLALLAFFLPSLIDSIIPKKQIEIEVGVTEISDLTTPDEVQEKPKEFELPPVPPPPPGIKFTAPVIKKDDEVADEEEIKDQEELIKSDLTITKVDVEKTDDNKDAEFIRDLEVVAQVTAPVEEKPFTVVEQMPEFPGGQAEMMRFINRSVRYPEIDRENGMSGRVTVRFVVSKTGKIENVEILGQGLSPTLNKEAIRVISLMPDWKPGRQNGVAVPVYFVAPINFKLN